MDDVDLEEEIRELEIQIEELEMRNLVPIGVSIYHSIDGMDPMISQLLIQSQTQKQPTQTSKRTKETLEKIQLENVNRMFGVTSFQITNDQSNNLLGLRFDVFNQFECKYVAPHYIILKKGTPEGYGVKDVSTIPNNEIWTIFKSTLPKYIPFNELAKEHLLSSIQDPTSNEELKEFTSIIYNQLDKIEIKKSQIQSLQLKCREKYGQKVHIKYDLNVYKVTITILGRIEIIILTDLDSVLSAVVIDDERKVTLTQRRVFEQLLGHSSAIQLDQSSFTVINKLFDLIL